MGEEKARLDLRGQAFQVRVGPGGQHVTEKAGFGLRAIPGDAEAIGIDRRVSAIELSRAAITEDQLVARAAQEALRYGSGILSDLDPAKARSITGALEGLGLGADATPHALADLLANPQDRTAWVIRCAPVA